MRPPKRPTLPYEDYGLDDYIRHIELVELRGEDLAEWKSRHPYHYTEYKRDGYCIMSYKNKHGELELYTLTPRRQEPAPQEWNRILQECQPNDSWIVGELFVPGGISQDVRSVLAKHPTKEGKFEAFFYSKASCIDEFHDNMDYLGIPTVDLVDRPDMNALPPDVEGFVHKAQYSPEKYSKTWAKEKAAVTRDLRIVSAEFAVKNRHIHKIKSILCRTDDGQISASVGIMTDAVRKEISENLAKYIGMIVEVTYQFKTRNGSLRHPRLERIREDKNKTSKFEDM